MTARGLSTEGQSADGTECLDCVQTHQDQARASLERDRQMEAEFAKSEAERLSNVDRKKLYTDTTDTNGHDGIPNRTCPFVSVCDQLGRHRRPLLGTSHTELTSPHCNSEWLVKFRVIVRAPLRGAGRSRVLRFS